MPLAEHISEKTHVNLTISTFASVLVFICLAIWRGAVWAQDVETAKETAAQTATAASMLKDTVATIVTTTAVQAQTQAAQQSQLNQIQALLQDTAEKSQDVRERLIRIEAKTSPSR